MSTKPFIVLIALAILFLGAGEALARRVSHVVTPASIDKLPFKASIKVKDLEKLKEVEIPITGIVGNLARQPCKPGGWVRVIGNDQPIAVKRSTAEGTATFTFQIGPELLEKARFELVEDVADWSRPFPVHGDLYQLELKDFVDKK